MNSSHQLQLKVVKAKTEMDKGNFHKSISICKKLLSKDKNNLQVLKLLSTNLIKLKRFIEVEDILKQAIRLADEKEALTLQHLLGCNYISLKNYDKAINTLELVFNQTGQSNILLDIALAYHELGNYEVARDIYLKLLEMEPNNHQAKFNLYPILLHFRDFKNAWACFHSRLDRAEIKEQVHWFATPWAGESLTGKNILIYPEQGIGDNLAYTGCFQEAINDANKTFIVCDNRLKALYQNNFPTAQILSYDEVNQSQKIAEGLDLQILAGSLSYLYRDSEESFQHQHMLSVDSELVDQVSNQLNNSSQLKIGLSWFHGRVNDGNEFSMYLEELLPLLKIEGIEWVNLQFGEWRKEVRNFEKKHGISITHIEACSAAGDFNQYAALIANLDLVISAGNAALMLASRLGKNAWMFLPGEDNRVDKNTENWLWHQSVKQIYQGKQASWQQVVETMCHDVQALLE